MTERRQAEGILSGFFAGSPVGLFILDSELRFVRVNDTLAAMNRVPAADHLGRTVGEVVPGIWELVEPLLRRVLDTGEPLRGVEVAVDSPSDPAMSEHALLSLFPITDPEGDVRSVGGVVVDISETKHAERELAENKDFLERVLGVTPEVIYIFDIVEQRNVFSNREMFDLLGYSPEEIRGHGQRGAAADTPPGRPRRDGRASPQGGGPRGRGGARGRVPHAPRRRRVARSCTAATPCSPATSAAW